LQTSYILLVTRFVWPTRAATSILGHDLQLEDKFRDVKTGVHLCICPSSFRVGPPASEGQNICYSAAFGCLQLQLKKTTFQVYWRANFSGSVAGPGKLVFQFSIILPSENIQVVMNMLPISYHHLIITQIISQTGIILCAIILL